MAKDTILFVDSDKAIHDSIKKLLKPENYKLLFATSGKEALTYFSRKEIPALIVSEEKLPGGCGTELLAQIKKLHPDCIRILLTRPTRIKTVLGAINKSGIYRYLTKPWDEADLKLSIKKGLKHYRLIQKNRKLQNTLIKTNESLDDLTTNLENMVRERTTILNDALRENIELNKSLRKKVVELKGRDKILNNILTIKPLEETLSLILQVAANALDADSGAIFLPQNKDKKNLQPIASRQPKNKNIFSIKSKNYTIAKKVLRKKKTACGLLNSKGSHKKSYVSVPILRKKECLGVIHLVRHKGAYLNHSDVLTINKLTKHAVIAITDSQIPQDISNWPKTIDDFLATI